MGWREGQVQITNKNLLAHRSRPAVRGWGHELVAADLPALGLG